jgi:dephospho-CoA kinase
MTFVVALTGGIASGKTTVADLFHHHFAIDIVDADIIARQVVAIGTPGLKQITQHFGSTILNQDGSLNRAELRQRIFSQPKEKNWLEALLHPLIRLQMQTALQQTTSAYALLVVPLLVENHLESMADRVLVVDVDEKTQIQRTMQRDNVAAEQAKNILAAQATRQQRLAIADDVIENNVNSEQLLLLVTKLHQKYLAISGKNL